MSKDDIQSWLSAAGPSSDDENSGWHKDRVLSEWPQAMEFARSRLLESKTSVRISFMNEELKTLVKLDLSLQQIMDIFGLLTLTYPRYADSKSRDTVETLGMELISMDLMREDRMGVAEQIIGWLSHEVSQRSSSSSVSDTFVLLSWTCGIYTVCLKNDENFASSHAYKTVVGVLALLLDHLYASSKVKFTMKSGALVRTRRALRSAGNKLDTFIKILLALSFASSHTLKFVPLLGVAVSVLIRLKHVQTDVKNRLSDELKNSILSLYTTSIVMSNTYVPEYVPSFLDDFIQTYVNSDDLSKTVLPAAEKALLRAPEYSIPVMSAFFSAYRDPLSDEMFKRVVTHAINAAKSTHATVRSQSLVLFKAVAGNASSSQLDLAISELYSLPKSGKSAGPDHRIALYTMLSFISPSSSSSPAIVQTAVPLITKETHAGVISSLAAVLPPHIVLMLQKDINIPQDSISSIVKEMGNSKPALRKAFCVLAGSSISGVGDLTTNAAKVFAKGILAPLLSSLKAISANPLTSAAGPLEGYVAVTALLGPYAKSEDFFSEISSNPIIQNLGMTLPKPSFLLHDKVYQKLTDVEEQTWLLQACDAAIKFIPNISSDTSLKTHLGLILIHLVLEGAGPEVRKKVHEVVENAADKIVMASIVHDAIEVLLSRHKSEDDPIYGKHSRLSALMLSSVSFGDVELPSRQDAVAAFFIQAHHVLIAGQSTQTWIDLCQKARCDPHHLVNAYLNTLFALLLDASTAEKVTGLPNAAYRAARTIAFVSPNAVVFRLIQQIQADLDPVPLSIVSETDLNIWFTPEGTTYVNVLVTKTDDPIIKGKDAEILKWEAELRKAIASKKGTPTTLTKQQQSLVNSQLEKEAKIRQHINLLKARLLRGLHLIESLVNASVSEFHSHVVEVLELLLSGPLDKGSPLVGTEAYETYLIVAKYCSDRLDTFAQWIGIATLRCLRPAIVPQNLQVEELASLILRVLYRLRFLAEQTPFDAPTLFYAFPLLQAIMNGGKSTSEDAEEVLEQVSLTLDIVRFHIGDYSNPSYPRAQTVSSLLSVIKGLPKLAKDASSTLIDLGEAIHLNATKDEIHTLLQGMLSQEVYIRNSCLQALQPFDLTDFDWAPEILIACHDDDAQNVRLARHLWEDNGLDIPEVFMPTLLDFLDHENAHVRSAGAKSICEAVEHFPETIQSTVQTLQDQYREKAKILAPEMDAYGMIIASSLDRSDPWQTRAALALSLEELAPFFTATEVCPFFIFLIQDEALGDRDSQVRRGMLAAGTAVIDIHGASHLGDLIGMFEQHLGRSSPGTETADYIQEAVVILFGRVARHLGSSDPRIPNIVNRLVDALKTPSEQVQIAVSDCLAPLVRMMQHSEIKNLIDSLLDDLFNSKKYAVRRGSAYGIAGVIKGDGISAFKEFEIIERLKEATEDKKRSEGRQGVMFSFETLSFTLGRVFEPYITYVLPLLLNSFGDASTDVREATQDAARVIMGNLSGYGLKLILPTLLEGLDQKQWRTKKGSIELLGMMAYCAPRQLSLSLPVVIPPLTEVLTDSHAQVRSAANKSLKQFGEVISNPEIQSLVPTLLKALVDPTRTPNALSSLLKTSFMHVIDQSSLALVVPIIERGLRERGADTKKKAAQIVGNLASLTDSKDFVPYLDQLLPLVHVVLVDPVPEARATAAKALGTLVERLGEEHFPDLVPSLLRTLKTDTSGVDRQGAAQGLSEVLSGLGMDRLEGLLPDIINNAQSPRATVREGFMSLLVYLPATFGTRFQPHLPKIITPILNGLSDVEDYVREAAMRAGRMVINNYSNRAIDLLLPQLERGMFDPGWRIRQSSITLVSELLFKVSGISGKLSDFDEEEEAAVDTVESSRRALVDVLGIERRDRLLAALYLVRQDGVAAVRQQGIQIWKALVHNTPRTVREILPELINQIVTMMMSDEEEHNETASRTITELCKKFGEKIVGDIMAILRDKEPQSREGVCLTLCELISNSTESQREDHEVEIIAIVRVSLVDDDANVRAAAAKAFDVLQEYIGARAIDETIPTLLEALRQPGKGSGTALQALREVMAVRASTVFPVLIPTLTALPMTVFNARALASLVSVASQGDALSRRLTVILGALVKVIEDQDKDEELSQAVDEALHALLSAVNNPEGLNTIMMLFIGWAKHDRAKRRVSAYEFFSVFCGCASEDLDTYIYRVDWIRQLVSAMDDPVPEVVAAAWNALDVFVRSLPKDELEPLAVPLRRSIESTGAPGTTVAGFSRDKGVSPFIPIIIAGLTTGSNEQRENAAYAIGDLVARTEETAIKPFVVPFTGPLIRQATSTTSSAPGVKTSILSALKTMLEKIPVYIKPFYPQLQRTFVKALTEKSGVVRTMAAEALGVLMKNQPRVDPVVTELVNGARGNEDEGVQASMVYGLAHIIKNAGQNMGPNAQESCVELVYESFEEAHEDNYVLAIGRLFSALCAFPDLLLPTIERYLVGGTPPSVIASTIIATVLDPDEDWVTGSGDGNVFRDLGLLRNVGLKVKESIGNERTSIARPAREAKKLLEGMYDEELQGLF